MTSTNNDAHGRAIQDQFSRQAVDFAVAPELHGDEVVALVVDATKPNPGDSAIDLACGPGSVACAVASRVKSVVGLDATESMLDQARELARSRGIENVEWRAGDVYEVPYPDGSFDVVACRFSFHHFEHPEMAFAEMVRLAAPGGRIVVCDGLASDEPAKAAAFNAMERRRDPSTIEFRTLLYLRRLFELGGLGDPAIQRFDVPYVATELVARSFPENDDRAGLLALIEASVDGDLMDVGARRSPEGVRFAFRAAVLSAVKPGQQAQSI
jgi:SAM-dependent methyltransferase